MHVHLSSTLRIVLGIAWIFSTDQNAIAQAEYVACTEAPSASDDYSTVWTGTELIAWGGGSTSAIKPGVSYNLIGGDAEKLMGEATMGPAYLSVERNPKAGGTDLVIKAYGGAVFSHWRFSVMRCRDDQWSSRLT